MPKNTSLKTILIIGSGPIVIGQACEFDYSGSQAARSLKEEGIHTIVINSNPATIMTDPLLADKVYLFPLTPDSVEKILQENNVDAVLPTMGGQTGLNLCKECEEIGIWKKYNVKFIGVDMDAIEECEDRDKFRELAISLGIPIAKSKVATSILKGKEIAEEIGIPLVIRPSFTLGGKGGGFVLKEENLDASLKRGLTTSPVHEILIEQAVLGWKEYELELIKDKNHNIIVICTVENLDPMGVHTGDSITVAPAMTLSDTCYQKMRDYAFKLLRSFDNFHGGCNVQFAVNPETEEIFIVEINPRVSRSSALASKATGYPIAKIAAKLAIGYALDELKNQITKTTSAFFEPALDYVIVKIPRWDFNKFKGANDTLTFSMKSVGEVMGIGRCFEEAIQKACQSLENNALGLGYYGKSLMKTTQLLEYIKKPKWDRIFRIKDALLGGVTINTISNITGIDKWYINKIADIAKIEKAIIQSGYEGLTKELLFEAKTKGFSDVQISKIVHPHTEEDIRKLRKKYGIHRVYKTIDSCSAEFQSNTPYLYSTFESNADTNTNESIVNNKKKVIILGSGPNRIGQGIEFDYCCVHGTLSAKEEGYEVIMVNCNPETVSTDFDIADKLYFEPIFWEYIYDIYELEQADGIIVQLGGQTAIKLSKKIHDYNIPIVGTNFNNMDLAEDRGRFSSMLKKLNIPYPNFGTATDANEAIEIANKIGYPVLVRPSYVLGGQRMKIAIKDEDLEKNVISILKHLPNNNILIDQFLDKCLEAEVDAICDQEDIHIMGIMEHIEPAGIHSGDSHATLPVFDLSDEMVSTMVAYTKKIALELKIKGLINIQFAIKNNKIYVIEANPRASRTTPFISKAYGIPYLNIATKVMLGKMKVADIKVSKTLKGYAIKKPIFSFDRFENVNGDLGPEMKSTGEAIIWIDNLNDPVFRNIHNERNINLSL